VVSISVWSLWYFFAASMSIWKCNFGLRFISLHWLILLGHVQLLLLLLNAGEEQWFENENERVWIEKVNCKLMFC